MNFTPKTNVGAIVRGILTIAVVGLIIGLVSHFGVQKSFPTSDNVSAVEPALAAGFQTANSAYYQPVSSWYKNKHWWKRNAPIVGGAAGGALIGGLAGGGTGAIIGGAVGGGGGYAYKRLRHNNHHHHYQKYRYHR
jgi:hypothetical protein